MRSLRELNKKMLYRKTRRDVRAFYNTRHKENALRQVFERGRGWIVEMGDKYG